jgi:aldose sugar dehydrogenase
MRTALLSSFAAVALLFTGPGAAQERILRTEAVSVQATTIAEGLEHPWGLAFLPEGDLLVTERPGRLRIVSGGRLSTPVAGVPQVAVSGQGGLLDVALAADFERSGTIFLSYSEPGRGGAGTAIARARLVRDGQRARLDDVRVIFSMARKTGARQHFGSRIVVHPDGSLFFSIGDRGDGNRAQDPRDHAGALLRINPDGSVPPDNPSPDGAAHLPEIWSKGHRNIQGAAYDPVTRAIWTVEHGARGGDEVNRPQAGRNYGWPVISYGRNYSGTRIGVGTSARGYEQPLHYWDPSIAPSGMAIYDGTMFPEWQGDILVGALRGQLLSRLDRDPGGAIVGEERMFQGEIGRVRDVRVAPDGSVYLLIDAAGGSVVRIARAD